MTTLTQLPTTDLILRVSGGSRDGELIPVDTPKCYLGMEATNEAISENPFCVIFRGRDGAVIRSYTDQVVLNDSAASLHWLRKGDTIAFPNALKVEVVQIGQLKETRSEAKTRELAAADSLEDSRLVILESELRSIQLQNENSVSRFDQLDNRLNMLTEKMTMLINLSSNGSGFEVSQATAPQTTGLIATTVNTSEAQTEEKIINPIENKSQVESPESEATKTEETTQPVQSSTESQVPAEENIVENDATGVQVEEVIQSPLSSSPLDELNRIDQAIEESVSGYSSQNDDSEEQILTFDADSAASFESVAASDASVVEEQVVTTPAETPTSSTDEATSSDTTEEAATVEAATDEADAQAKAISDAAEKESRISEMERIFGGALSESESDDKKETEQSATQPAGEQLSETFEDQTHGPNAKVDSPADNTFSSESFAKDEIQSDDSNESDDQPKADSTKADDLESQLSPMARQLLQDVKSEQKQDSLSTSESVVSNASALERPVRPEPETLIVPERKENESVTSLLDRMKQDEKWDDVLKTDDAPAESDDAVEAKTAEVETETVEAETAETETTEAESVETETPVAEPKPARAEPETLIVPERKENESVADLLARMKQDGKWDGVLNDDDAPEETVEPIQSTPEPEPMPSSMDDSADGEGDDVEDYMSQLLSRMRGEEPAATTNVKQDKPKQEKGKAKAKAKKKVEAPKFEAPADPLKPEDFKPKQKAKKIKSLDAMREIANKNSRTNVQVSEVRNQFERSASFLTAAGIGGLMLGLFYLFAYGSTVLGLLSMLIPAGCAAFYFFNMKKDKDKSLAPLASSTETEKPEEPTQA